MVLKKTSESSLGSKEIKPVNLRGNQHWILIGRTDAEAEAPVFWSSDANSRLLGKVPDAGKDRGQKEKRASEDEMAVWHHQYNGHELGQTSGDGKGQGGLVCCRPWGCEESDMTGWLNNKKYYLDFTEFLLKCKHQNIKVTKRLNRVIILVLGITNCFWIYVFTKPLPSLIWAFNNEF